MFSLAAQLDAATLDVESRTHQNTVITRHLTQVDND